jgi:hypothetical protein
MIIRALLFLLLIPFLVEAAPEITGGDRTLAHGGSFVVSGENFSAPGPNILLWDDFEGATGHDQDVMGNYPVRGATAWDSRSNGAEDPKYWSLESYSGNWSANCKFEYGGGENWGTIVALKYYFPATGTLYQSWWTYNDPRTSGGARDYSDPNNSKLMYTWSNAPQGNFMWQGIIDIYDYYYLGDQGCNDENGPWYTSDIECQYLNSCWSWHRFSSYWKMNSSDGSHDGEVKGWCGTVNVVDDSGINFDGTNPDCGIPESWMTHINIGAMWENGPQIANPYRYVDDVYLADSQARIEIGDASTWAACSVRIIQLPDSWNDGSITYEANQSALSEGTQYWLYVVDGNGNPNSTGYAVDFGEVVPRPCGN